MNSEEVKIDLSRNSGFRVPNYLVHPRDSNPHFLRKLGSQVAVESRKLSSATLDSICSFFGRHRLQKLSLRFFASLTRGGAPNSIVRTLSNQGSYFFFTRDHFGIQIAR